MQWSLPSLQFFKSLQYPLRKLIIEIRYLQFLLFVGEVDRWVVWGGNTWDKVLWSPQSQKNSSHLLKNPTPIFGWISCSQSKYAQSNKCYQSWVIFAPLMRLQILLLTSLHIFLWCLSGQMLCWVVLQECTQVWLLNAKSTLGVTLCSTNVYQLYYSLPVLSLPICNCISLYFVDNILFEGTWKLATHTFQQTQLLFILCYHCLMCKWSHKRK